ncbi:hypothetical protein RA307_01700 [Xanthobacteraceae bacterium Astr-EGSB]|uniref:DUF7662 domain-containing protein n=1 Tax=Astrobacterium formosum TaxID=3069710 RepID=UPI0027B124EA|nr:hypothetical protein [Xanthobacteraceae bacterium Astr-EGSB]
MTKYDPLGHFLRGQQTDLVRLSFADVERIIGAKLPRSSQNYPAWWSNNPTNNVMTKVWLAAGFKTEQVDIEGRRLVFRRVSKDTTPQPPATSVSTAPPPPSAPSGRHPAYGVLKGLVRILAGTDLTQPADPDWGRRTSEGR